MKKNVFRFISIFLSLILVFQTLPLAVLAVELREEAATAAESIDPIPENKSEEAESEISRDSSEPTVLNEVEDRREPNKKTFRMSDGTFREAVYPYDVHYEDATGALLDIDNTLVKDTDGGEGVLVNEANASTVRFFKKSSSGKFYSLENEKNKVTVSIEGAEKVDAVFENTPASSGNSMALTNLTGRVSYAEIFPSVDLEYTLVSKRIKENVIIKEKGVLSSLTYTYAFNGGMTAVQNNAREIIIFEKNSENVLFTITAPALWDSAGNYSENLTLTIVEAKNSKLTVRLDFTIDEEMVYPVTVDPVLQFQAERNSIQDTHIISAYPTTNYNTNNHIRIRNNGYALLQFPTPSLQPGDKIIGARVALFPYGYFDNSLSIYSNANSYNPTLKVTAHKINTAWNEKTVTYQSANPDNGFYDSTAESYHVVGSNSDFYSWDITRLAMQWTEGTVANHGILLKYAAPPSDGSMFDTFFCSTNGAFIQLEAWPQIVYSYINTIGIEEYFSYHTQSLGFAGEGYVNDMTGNLTVTRELVTTGGNVAPISLSLIYNTANATSIDSAPYGTGWKLNLAQKCVQVVPPGSEKTYVQYTDADGTQHYFTMDAATGIWTDEIDPDRKIYFNGNTNDYEMKDSSGTTMFFTKRLGYNEWYLYKIVDLYGNFVQLYLDEANLNRVKTVWNSNGTNIYLDYSQYGFLTAVRYNDEGIEETININYNNRQTVANNGISDIIFPDQSSARYSYWAGTYWLSAALNLDNSFVQYDYHYATGRVSAVSEISSVGEVGNRFTFAYEPTATTVTDTKLGRTYLYTFSANGTLKSVVDTTANDGNGYGQYYEYNGGNTSLTGMGNLTFASKTQKNTVNLLPNHSFEQDGYVIPIAYGTDSSSAHFGFTNEKARLGNRSYKMTAPSSGNYTEMFAHYFMTIPAAEQYTLSAYINTANMEDTDIGGASVVAIVGDQNYYSEYITETRDEWQRLSVSFSLEQSQSISLGVSLSGATGSIYIDNIQLETGGLSDYNLLENAGFEFGTEQPDSWYGTYYCGAFNTANEASGERSYALTVNPNICADVMQYVPVGNGKKGDTYVASAFAKAISVNPTAYHFCILVSFVKNNVVVNGKTIPFNHHTTGWQKISGAVKAEGDYDTIQFWLLYYQNVNQVCFDNAQLIQDTFGNTYTYDSKGNLLSTVDLEGKAEYTFKYNGNNQLIKESTVSGGKILYSYNSSKKQQLDLATAGGISTAYTYDSKGNATSTSTMGTELIEGKSYYLQNVYYSKYLNVTNSGTASGTAVGLADFSKNSAQRWRLIENADGSYSLSPECANTKLLSVNGSALANSVNLALYSSGEKTYQKFKLVKRTGNFYCLDIAENTNYAIDSNGTNVYTHSMHHGEIQQFAFIPVSDSNSSSNPAIISSATYTSNGEYTSSVTDSRGNTTSYEYNEDRGYLKSETNANGVKTSYSYNNSELLQSVSLPNGTETPTVSYDYDSYKRLETITSPSGTVYGFTYDSFSRGDTVKVGTRTLSDYLYDSKGRVDSFTYGNGTAVKYGYDNLNRQTSTTINNVLRYKKIYDGHSRLLQIEDILLGKKVKYEYDILDRLVGERLINTATNNIFAQLNIRYDNTKNRVAGYDINIEGINKATDFVYGENKNAPDIITSVKHNGTKKLGYSYDSLNRIIARTLSTGTAFTTEYTYIAGRTKGSETDNTALTTTLVKTVKNGEDTLEYAYDKLGNITSISKNGTVLESYTYDNLNQLKTVTKGEDVWEYTYDNGGNILSVTLNDEVIKTYTYGDSEWKDLLTNFNGTGFTYDNIGNPLTYRDGMSFTWADGRKLASITKGTDSISYTYDINGLRTSKTVNGITTEYYWLNGMLQGQKTGSEHIIFLYDENGMAYGFLVYENGVASGEYYYIFNAQGDVIGILDNQGTKVVEYTYNAWGELLSTTGTLADTIGQKNPLRYRGYYFDCETGFYYLQSRYYDPVVQRFINADGLIDNRGIITQNLFQYCGNNPVNNADLTGNLFGAIVGIGLVVIGISALLASSDGTPKDYRKDHTAQNCYGYAFDLKDYGGNPGKHSEGKQLYSNSNTCTVDEVAEYVIRDMNALGKKVRIVDSPKEKRKNEYIVALNVQTKLIETLDYTDFHFAVQLSDGRWADKTPAFASQIGIINGESAVWYLEPIFYDSGPVFFAVER